MTVNEQTPSVGCATRVPPQNLEYLGLEVTSQMYTEQVCICQCSAELAAPPPYSSAIKGRVFSVRTVQKTLLLK